MSAIGLRVTSLIQCHTNIIITCRVSQLEKDLYYYKKTSRELKRRLREYVSSGTIPAQGTYTSVTRVEVGYCMMLMINLCPFPLKHKAIACH